MARHDPEALESFWRNQNPRRLALRDELDARRLPYAIGLWNLTKNWNIGNLIRTANAFLCGEILLIGSEGFDASGSAGIHRFEPMRHFASTDAFWHYAHGAGYEVVAVEIDARAEWLPRLAHPKKPLFLFGSELEGLPETLIDQADHRVMIPQYGLIPCLNVNVSCSIVLYDHVTRCHPEIHPVEVREAKFKLDPGSGQR